MQRRALAQAAEILKAHRAAARVAKARQLSPAFYAECRKAERPVGFWQWAGYVHGRCRGGYLKLTALGVAIWFLIRALIFLAPYLGQLTVVLLAGWSRQTCKIFHKKRGILPEFGIDSRSQEYGKFKIDPEAILFRPS